jgi:transposase
LTIAFHIDIGTLPDKLKGMKAYALDLRERVVKFINNGGSKAEAARRFDLGRRTVYRYLAAVAAGTLAPKASWGHWRKLDPQKLQVHVKQHPDATLKELQKEMSAKGVVFEDRQWWGVEATGGDGENRFVRVIFITILGFHSLVHHVLRCVCYVLGIAKMPARRLRL